MKKRVLAVLTIVLVLFISLFVYIELTGNSPSLEPINYTYKVVAAYPHDQNAFTEGLVYDDGVLFEGTGLVGQSSLRRVDLETGQTLQLFSLDNDYFGEGITIFEGRIIQLTWRSHKGFVYDKGSLDILADFGYDGEGWGITQDGTRLIMSNGSATLSFLDPVTFEVVGEIEVTDGDSPVANLNELEYINGDVYANVWRQDRIAIIDISTGRVKGWINLAGLYSSERVDPDNVLNGIAYDVNRNRLFVTGKRWSQLFEIRLEPVT